MSGENDLSNKMLSAAKWSSITEIAAKLVSPISNMILARLLVPEAFGVVATVTMIVSFADMFTDAGFQKYLIQHSFKTEEDKFKSANVAFWTNFSISILLWLIILFNSDQIAVLVGNPGLGGVIAVASFQLPVTSFSSVQMALYRRDFDFKTLFLVRLVSIFLPFIITIPLAIIGMSYWSLIVGVIFAQLANAIILTFKSKWKPKLYFDLGILKRMFSFSFWSLVEAVSIWFTLWIDTFIISSTFSQYYLGLYKTSISMGNSMMALITSATVPIIFSALSRLQDDDEQFRNVFLKFQRVVSVIIFPLGVGVYLYSDIVTQILLGDQWVDASGVIGLWALTSALVIIFGHYCSEVYRAKGNPKLSFLAQILHLVVLVPTCIFASKFGFWALVYARSWIRMEAILVHFVLMKFIVGITAFRIIKNLTPTIISTIIMALTGYVLSEMYTGVIWSFISIVICALVYFGVLFLFPCMKNEVISIFIRMIRRSK